MGELRGCDDSPMLFSVRLQEPWAKLVSVHISRHTFWLVSAARAMVFVELS